ncbi:glycosyltransferase family 2 protein [Streptococcus sp.]
MEKQLISVIVPIYNVENYLRQCLDSVLGQTFKNFEVLLVNDGSSDSSGDICREYVEKDSRFHYFEKENGGLSDARNYGIERAQGEYLTFIDSDDFVNEKHLENLFLASRLTNADITIGGFSRFENGTFWLYQDYFSSDSLVSFTSAQAIQHLDSMFDVPFLNFSIVCGKLFKRDLFKELRFQYGKYAEDQFIIWKLYLKARSIYTFNVDSYVYRINNTGMSSVFSLKHLDYIDALEERIKFTKDIDGIDIGLSFNMYRYVLKRILQQLEEHDYIDEAKEVREKLELAEQGQYPFLTDEVKEIEVENGGELISIVVPIYNVENYLRMCLDSIEHQTYSNIEVLLINDGSPDSSGEICQEYVARDSRFRYFEKENGGLSDARNYGIERSNGKYLTFIDSDDWVEPTYIDDMYQAALKNDSEIVVSNYTLFDVKENHYLIHVWDDYYEETYEGEELINKLPLLERRDYSFVTSWGILFKKELFNNIKFPKGKVIEDSRTNYKLFARSLRSTYINKALYNYRIGRESISSQVNEKLLIDVLECLLERLAVYTIKGWNISDEKENILKNLNGRYEQAKEAGLQDTEIFRRYTEILELIDNK